MARGEASPGVEEPRRPAAALCLALGLLVGTTAASGAEPPRLLVLGLDGVPYHVIAELADPARGEAALFTGLSGPVPMISTFPSTTNVALSGMMEAFGVEKSMGYEVRFFDREANQVRGGGPISYHRLRFPWRERFDFGSESLLAAMVAKLRPVKASIHEIDEALEKLFASDEEVLFAYVGSTDGAGHLRSPESLTVVLEALDAALARLRRLHPDQPFYVLLFSDHGQAGGEPLENVRGAVRRALKAGGYRIVDRLAGTRDVAIPELGMVSSFVVYTRPGREGEVRRLLAAAPGVELCVSRQGGGYLVENAGGAAFIGRREGVGGEAWSYQPVDDVDGGGDPLGYRPVVEELRSRAGSEDLAWFPDRWWLEATAAAPYPDALYRLARAFDVVENPASVLCSTGPGHLYAAWRTEKAADLTVGPLRWTHGSLRAEPTLGFLATDLPGWRLTGPVRFTQVLAPAARWQESNGTPPAQLTAE